jgi:hypothetical protein
MSEAEKKTNPLAASILPMPTAQAADRSNDGIAQRAARLRTMTNDVPDDKAAEASRAVAKTHGIELTEVPGARHAEQDDTPPPPPAPARQRTRPVCPINREIEMPLEGQVVDWGGNLRADFPVYAMDQLNEFCHKNRCTVASALLQFMASFKDPEERPYFYIRPEDMVPDRRKALKRAR